MEKSKKTIIQAIVCMGLIVMIWSGYFLIKKYSVERILDVKADDFSWVFQMDSAEINDGEFLLNGFAFQLGKDAVGDNYEIVLRNLETGKDFFPKMVYKERKDVNEYFLCEYDYSLSGFEAEIREKKIDLQEKDYEILLRLRGERMTYQTGIYLTKGKLAYTNPKEFIPLETEGSALDKIVKEGVLRVYRPEEGMYIYQFEGALYWIAEEKFFTGGEKEHIEFQLGTTQINKLPEDRLAIAKEHDNRVFIFERNELKGQNNGRYRVAVNEVPKEYAITEILTGNYVDEWIWSAKFRPYYAFGR